MQHSDNKTLSLLVHTKKKKKPIFHKRPKTKKSKEKRKKYK